MTADIELLLDQFKASSELRAKAGPALRAAAAAAMTGSEASLDTAAAAAAGSPTIVEVMVTVLLEAIDVNRQHDAEAG
jgi:hypothetical protein